MQGDLAKYKIKRMNKGLMKKMIKDLCKRYGVEPDLLDIEHLTSEALRYNENLSEFVKEYLFPLMDQTHRELFLLENKDIEGLEENAEKQALEEWKNYAIKEAQECKEEVAKELKNLDAILKEVENYNAFQKNITWCSILALCSRERYFKFNVLNVGGAGLGKSHSSYELVKNYLNVPHAVTHNAILTPKRFFMFIKENADKVIIEDEADLLLLDKKTKVMLKHLLFASKLCWETTQEYEEITFNGSIIMNANTIHNSDIAILDRCFTNIVNVTNTLILKKLQRIQNYEPNKQIWDTIRKRINYTYNNIDAQEDALLDKEEEKKIYELLELLISKKKELASFRAINRAKELFYRLKLFFNCSPLKNEQLLELFLDLLTFYV